MGLLEEGGVATSSFHHCPRACAPTVMLLEPQVCFFIIGIMITVPDDRFEDLKKKFRYMEDLSAIL